MSINKYVFSNRDLCPTGEVFYCVITSAVTKLPTKVIPKKISAHGNGYSFCIFFQNDKISVFNPCFIDNFFKWHNICDQYVITPNVSLNLV